MSGASPSFAQVRIEYACVGNCIRMYKGVQLEFQAPPTHWETVRPQHDRPFACVIAQQYSSPTVVSLRFQSREENCGALFKTTLFHCFIFFKIT